jgi:hypothetical protein
MEVTMKSVLLNGNQHELVELNNFTEALNLLGISELQGYHSFGKGYTALWQEERREKTSMEITVYAGASYPIFIDSKVIIINEGEEGDLLDVDLNDLKKHFNMSKSFWALMRNFA